MKTVHIDAKTGREIPAHEVLSRSCVGGFISWLRLAEVLRQAGELGPNERVDSFYVSPTGLGFLWITEG